VRRLRLAILGASPCGGCRANCCRQNGHDYAVLLDGADERRRFQAFCVEVQVAAAGARVVSERVLPYRDGRCQFLGDDDRCTIYEDRPLNCRRFECAPGFHLLGSDLTGHSEFLRRNPDVLQRLETL
jgi:hypothetical protein